MAAASSSTEGLPNTYRYEGLLLLNAMPPSALAAVKKLKLYPEDLLLISYPKSGRTWLREIVWLIRHDADTEAALNIHQNDRTYFLEFQYPFKNEPEVLRMPRIPPRIMTSHLVASIFEEQLNNGSTKVIVIIRDLKDTLVSYFNMYKDHSVFEYKGSWDTFFELFKKGELVCGDWGEFYKSWLQYKDDPKFLFLRYEDLKANHGECVRMIAKHCKKTLTEDQINKIVKHTGFEEMKKNPMVQNKAYRDFYRKGVVGDWVNYFSAEQLRYIEKYEKELDLSL